jgi:hypothetical protein
MMHGFRVGIYDNECLLWGSQITRNTFLIVISPLLIYSTSCSQGIWSIPISACQFLPPPCGLRWDPYCSCQYGQATCRHFHKVALAWSIWGPATFDPRLVARRFLVGPIATYTFYILLHHLNSLIQQMRGRVDWVDFSNDTFVVLSFRRLVSIIRRWRLLFDNGVQSPFIRHLENAVFWVVLALHKTC